MPNKPKNIQTIENWIIENRPELVSLLPLLIQDDKFIAFTTIGFEAGRKFQKENPDAAEYPTSYMD